jgi:hypothetical protein
MKSLRRLLSAALLISAMAFAASADDGIIHGDGPSPSPSSAAAPGDPVPDDSTRVDGIIHGDAPCVADAAVDAALRAVADLLAIY